MNEPAPRRCRPLVTPAATLVVAGLLAVGCSSGGGETTTPTSGPGGGAGGHGGAPGECVSRTPGELLSEVEAVVRFTPEQICPGYVTIAAGTRVTWVNRDGVAHEVRITQGATPVAAELLGPGRSWQYQFDTAGVYTFETDAIEAFRGTVEVQGGGVTVSSEALT